MSVGGHCGVLVDANPTLPIPSPEMGVYNAFHDSPDFPRAELTATKRISGLRIGERPQVLRLAANNSFGGGISSRGQTALDTEGGIVAPVGME